ncbi:MAG TPA: ATP-binding protein [Hydrogenophaga sp.]|uniref:sensor histidine kinase n=1 Tax=Hydrogenophaga sp. TaxID=1904254 RepID=UPI002BD6DAFA|nr:ATP-binding protein [Hydrogenophaga sp.]HSX95300.1 ATP-binding protein [Hydrogenophaga sp.]
MPPSSPPATEGPRLARLRALGVLDTLPERAYDDIAALAQSLCDTPIALVSLVDAERQWFKARIGLPLSETPRDWSFCSNAIQAPAEVLVIEDVRHDPRFVDHPLQREQPDLRFYAGAPIVTRDGLALGTVCVMDVQTRRVSTGQVEGLRRLAGLAATLLEQGSQDVETLRRNEVRLSRTVALLERKTVEQQRFIYMLSHDLREPVNTINNFSALLVDDHQAELAPPAQRYLGFVREGGRRIGRLLDDLVEFAQLDTHPLRIEAVDAAALAQRVTQDLAPVLQRCQGRVEIDTALPVVMADPGLLRVALHNLLSNALKFTRPGVPPVVTVGASRGGAIDQIHVSDNGMGIAQEHQGRIFGLFNRLHNRRRYDGTGLGLPICQRIAELHQGSLTLESSIDVGSRFTLHLPAQADRA